VICCKKIYRAVIFLALALGISCTEAAALDLEPGKQHTGLVGALMFLKDDGETLKEAIAAYRQGRFSADRAVFSGARNSFDPVWMAVELTNKSIDDGRPPDRWILISGTPLMSSLTVSLVRGGGLTEVLLDYTVGLPFDSAVESLNGLKSDPIALAPGETALLIMRYQPGPVRTVRMALETPQSLADRAVGAGVGYAAFYAFSLACLVFFAGFNLSMRNAVGLLYSGLFLFGLALIAHIDGFLFRFFWPNAPGFNLYVGLLAISGMTSFGFLVAGRSIAVDGRENAWSRAATLLAAVPLLLVAMVPVLGQDAVALPGYLLFVLMFIANVVATSIWRKQEGNVHAIVNLAAAALAVMVAALLIMVLTGHGLQAMPFHIVAKLIYTMISLSTMVALTAHIVMLRRNHQQAVRREIEALALEAEKSRALLEAEKNYSRARDLASRRQRQLATASHDLKQPLASLRMTMDRIADDRDPEIRERLKEAFDYMEGLAASYLAETRPEDEAETDEDETGSASDTPAVDTVDAGDAGETVEPYPVSLILRTVHQMFHEEAISKGLAFSMVDCGKQIAVPPLVMMRIVSNLVSNAVKYTGEGKVLFGCRRRGGRLAIEVHDTGRGMSADELADLLQPYRKGETSEGEGLGLAICAQLAAKHGLGFDASSEPGNGTCFRLEIPRA
jgi:signal transduction histidine kinase